MAININNKLTTFAQQELVLGYSSTERDRIDASLSKLEEVIKNKLSGKVKEVKRFGSYTRNTILPRNYDSRSDVDLLVIFRTDKGIFTPGTYRTWLQDVLSLAYPKSISKKDFPAVKLQMNHIMFDVVPAVIENSWGRIQYKIPGKSDSWQVTVPNDINESLKTRNQLAGDNRLRDVIRLCKHWNSGAGYPWASYEMEKSIINNYFFYNGDDLYGKFLNIVGYLGSSHKGTSYAISWIKQYEGGLFTPANEEKQLEWLRKLLPDLK